MNGERLAMVDAALLCISEARERAAAAARLAREDGDADLAAALVDTDLRLHELHGELMRATYMPAAGETQLRLAG